MKPNWTPCVVWVGRGYGEAPEGPFKGEASIWDPRTGRAILRMSNLAHGDEVYDGVPYAKWDQGLGTHAYSPGPQPRFDRPEVV